MNGRFGFVDILYEFVVGRIGTFLWVHWHFYSVNNSDRF